MTPQPATHRRRTNVTIRRGGVPLGSTGSGGGQSGTGGSGFAIHHAAATNVPTIAPPTAVTRRALTLRRCDDVVSSTVTTPRHDAPSRRVTGRRPESGASFDVICYIGSIGAKW